jgi:hypothetical protein
MTLEKELEELKKISTEISKHLTTVKSPKASNVWPQPTAGVPNRY